MTITRKDYETATPNEPIFPDVEVNLFGVDGNAFSIMGHAQAALRQAGVSREDIQVYLDEARAGDYNHLLTTTMKTVSCF